MRLPKLPRIVPKLCKLSDEEADAIDRWAKYGLVAGLVFGHLYASAYTAPSVGFYSGNLALVLLGFGGGGYCIGALAMWLDILDENRKGRDGEREKRAARFLRRRSNQPGE